MGHVYNKKQESFVVPAEGRTFLHTLRKLKACVYNETFDGFCAGPLFAADHGFEREIMT